LRGFNLHVELQAGQQAGRVATLREVSAVRPNSEEKSVRQLSPVRRMVTVPESTLRWAGRSGERHRPRCWRLRDNADGPAAVASMRNAGSFAAIDTNPARVTLPPPVSAVTSRMVARLPSNKPRH
jgi:hypothetical protein